MSLGSRVRVARRRAGVSQAGLAEMVGVTRSAVANWESSSARTYPSAQRLQRIAEETGVSYEWLATGRGSPAPDDSEIPAADAELIEDPVERLLLEGFRAGNEALRQGLLAIAESQLRGRRVKA